MFHPKDFVHYPFGRRCVEDTGELLQLHTGPGHAGPRVSANHDLDDARKNLEAVSAMLAQVELSRALRCAKRLGSDTERLYAGRDCDLDSLNQSAEKVLSSTQALFEQVRKLQGDCNRALREYKKRKWVQVKGTEEGLRSEEYEAWEPDSSFDDFSENLPDELVRETILAKIFAYVSQGSPDEIMCLRIVSKEWSTFVRRSLPLICGCSSLMPWLDLGLFIVGSDREADMIPNRKDLRLWSPPRRTPSDILIREFGSWHEKVWPGLLRDRPRDWLEGRLSSIARTTVDLTLALPASMAFDRHVWETVAQMDVLEQLVVCSGESSRLLAHYNHYGRPPNFCLARVSGDATFDLYAAPLVAMGGDLALLRRCGRLRSLELHGVVCTTTALLKLFEADATFPLESFVFLGAGDHTRESARRHESTAAALEALSESLEEAVNAERVFEHISGACPALVRLEWITFGTVNSSLSDEALDGGRFPNLEIILVADLFHMPNLQGRFLRSISPRMRHLVVIGAPFLDRAETSAWCDILVAGGQQHLETVCLAPGFAGLEQHCSPYFDRFNLPLKCGTRSISPQTAKRLLQARPDLMLAGDTNPQFRLLGDGVFAPLTVSACTDGDLHLKEWEYIKGLDCFGSERQQSAAKSDGCSTCHGLIQDYAATVRRPFCDREILIAEGSRFLQDLLDRGDASAFSFDGERFLPSEIDECIRLALTSVLPGVQLSDPLANTALFNILQAYELRSTAADSVATLSLLLKAVEVFVEANPEAEEVPYPLTGGLHYCLAGLRSVKNGSWKSECLRREPGQPKWPNKKVRSWISNNYQAVGVPREMDVADAIADDLTSLARSIFFGDGGSTLFARVFHKGLLRGTPARTLWGALLDVQSLLIDHLIKHNEATGEEMRSVLTSVAEPSFLHFSTGACERLSKLSSCVELVLRSAAAVDTAQPIQTLAGLSAELAVQFSESSPSDGAPLGEKLTQIVVEATRDLEPASSRLCAQLGGVCALQATACVRPSLGALCVSGHHRCGHALICALCSVVAHGKRLMHGIDTFRSETREIPNTEVSDALVKKCSGEIELSQSPEFVQLRLATARFALSMGSPSSSPKLTHAMLCASMGVNMNVKSHWLRFGDECHSCECHSCGAQLPRALGYPPLFASLTADSITTRRLLSMALLYSLKIVGESSLLFDEVASLQHLVRSTTRHLVSIAETTSGKTCDIWNDLLVHEDTTKADDIKEPPQSPIDIIFWEYKAAAFRSRVPDCALPLLSFLADTLRLERLYAGRQSLLDEASETSGFLAMLIGASMLSPPSESKEDEGQPYNPRPLDAAEHQLHLQRVTFATEVLAAVVAKEGNNVLIHMLGRMKLKFEVPNSYAAFNNGSGWSPWTKDDKHDMRGSLFKSLGSAVVAAQVNDICSALLLNVLQRSRQEQRRSQRHGFGSMVRTATFFEVLLLCHVNALESEDAVEDPLCQRLLEAQSRILKLVCPASPDLARLVVPSSAGEAEQSLTVAELKRRFDRKPLLLRALIGDLDPAAAVDNAAEHSHVAFVEIHTNHFPTERIAEHEVAFAEKEWTALAEQRLRQRSEGNINWFNQEEILRAVAHDRLRTLLPLSESFSASSAVRLLRRLRVHDRHEWDDYPGGLHGNGAYVKHPLLPDLDEVRRHVEQVQRRGDALENGGPPITTDKRT